MDARRYRKCAGNRGDWGKAARISHARHAPENTEGDRPAQLFPGAAAAGNPGSDGQRFHADAPPQQCEYLCGWHQWRLRWYLCWIWKGSALPPALCLLGGKRAALSHVQLAIGQHGGGAARSAVRFTLGIETTKEEIDITVDTVRRLTDKLRGR